MRSPPGALATHIALPQTTLAYALRIERQDGQVFGFTSADQDVTISAVLYEASPGLLVSSLQWTSGFAVDNLKLTTLDDGTVFSRDEILAGIWSNALFSLFEYNWASPSDGIDEMLAGTVGKVFLQRDTVVAELRGLQQFFQQPIGIVRQKTCRAHFCDHPQPAGVSTLCRLNVATYTHAGTVTSVTSKRVFTNSGQAQANAAFDEGIVNWLTGNNAGLSMKCKTYASKVFTLYMSMIGTIQIGDTYEAIRGCRKRRDEDCHDEYANVVNFQGEPDAPTVDAVTRSPTADA